MTKARKEIAQVSVNDEVMGNMEAEFYEDGSVLLKKAPQVPESTRVPAMKSQVVDLLQRVERVCPEKLESFLNYLKEASETPQDEEEQKEFLTFMAECRGSGKDYDECKELWMQREGEAETEETTAKRGIRGYKSLNDVPLKDLLTKSVPEILHDAGFRRINEEPSDPMEKDFLLVENWRKRNPTINSYCESLLKGEMGERVMEMPDELLRKMDSNFPVVMKHWEEYMWLHRNDNNNIIQKAKGEAQDKPNERRTMKRGLYVGDRARPKIVTPMDFSHMELMNLSTKQLLKKAGFEEIK